MENQEHNGINSNTGEPIVEQETIDTTIKPSNEKLFDPTKINIETKTPSLDTLIKRIERGNIAMETEDYFQRGTNLWDTVKQSRLIESILIRFPLPSFFFDASNDDKWLVVDGLQRLSSIRNFCVNKTLVLNNLEFLTHLNGKNWEQLPQDLQRVIEETQVVVIKIMPGSPNDVKFNIFKRINTGGLVLEPQEIRHALFQGKASELVAELAESPEFLKATKNKIPKTRMLDRDFVTRFLAFYILGYKEYQPDLDTFMSKSLAKVNTLTEEELSKIRQDFAESLRIADEIFGDKAFRKALDSYVNLPPINKALFDSLSSQLALIGEYEQKKLLDNKEEFRTSFANLLNTDSIFLGAVSSSTGDKGKVHYRHEKIEHLIQSAIKKS